MGTPPHTYTVCSLTELTVSQLGWVRIRVEVGDEVLQLCEMEGKCVFKERGGNADRTKQAMVSH